MAEEPYLLADKPKKIRAAVFLCLYGPYDGQWLTVEEAQKAGYCQYNRAWSWNRPKKLSAIMVHQESLSVKAGVKW